MEFMKINGFLGNAFSKLINKAVENKVGIKPDIDLDNLTVATTEEGLVTLNLSASMSQEMFEKLVEAISE